MTQGPRSRRIGQSDIIVPAVGVGAGQWADRNPLRPPSAESRRVIAETVAAATAAGLRLFDTAETYGLGRSERLLGAALAGLPPRADHGVIVATKYFPFPTRLRAAAVGRAVSASLRRLGRDHIDLYQVHFPFSWMSEGKLVAALAREVHAGRVRAIGVSNYSASQVRSTARLLAAHGVVLASHQVHYSLLHRVPESNGVLEICRELGVTLLCHTPLEHGLLTGTRPSRALAGQPRRAEVPKATVDAARPVLDELDGIARRLKATRGQVALAWLIDKNGVIALPGARHPDHATANAGALAVTLDGEDIARLDHASRPWLHSSLP